MRWLPLLLLIGAAGCSEEAPPSVEGVGREIVMPPPREIVQHSIYRRFAQARLLGDLANLVAMRHARTPEVFLTAFRP